MQATGLLRARGDGDPDQDVFGVGFGVFDAHVVVRIAVEHAGIGELELALVLAAAPVLFHEPSVRVLALRILVEPTEVRGRRRGIDVVVELLHVLAVVALGTREPEQPLFQDRIPVVPERDRKADPRLAVAEAEQTIFTPTIGAAARVVVREVVPAVAVLRVVLAHGAPLALREVGAPALPVLLAAGVLSEAAALGVFGVVSHALPNAGTAPWLPSNRRDLPA